MDEIRVRARWRAGEDNWHPDGSKIVTSEKLAAIQRVLEDTGSVIVEHCFYRGGSSPKRTIFENFDDFIEYLKTKTFAGDIIDVWSMHDLCTRQNRLAEGKMPDLDGCVPRGGAY